MFTHPCIYRGQSTSPLSLDFAKSNKSSSSSPISQTGSLLLSHNLSPRLTWPELSHLIRHQVSGGGFGCSLHQGISAVPFLPAEIPQDWVGFAMAAAHWRFCSCCDQPNPLSSLLPPAAEGAPGWRKLPFLPPNKQLCVQCSEALLDRL